MTLGTYLHPLIKVDNVLIVHADAARWDLRADGPWLIRAVDAI